MRQNLPKIFRTRTIQSSTEAMHDAYVSWVQLKGVTKRMTCEDVQVRGNRVQIPPKKSKKSKNCKYASKNTENLVFNLPLVPFIIKSLFVSSQIYFLHSGLSYMNVFIQFGRYVFFVMICDFLCMYVCTYTYIYELRCAIFYFNKV